MAKLNSDNRFEARLWQNEMTSTIDKWSIFRWLSSTMASRIRMAAVFGQEGNEAIFFTNDNEAFGLGDNNFGCLGVGHENKCLEPTKIKGLTNVRIKTMAFGFKHVVAVTESGSVLAWGDNEHYQLGNGTTNNVLVPEQVSALKNHRVVDVACGAHHTLALTEDGQVFAWGMNDKKQLMPLVNPKPIKVTESIGSQRAVAIGCCELSSFVVTDDGDVYSLDDRNFDGSFKRTLKRIDILNGIIVRRLACGSSHVLALTENGCLFVWGDNDCGQLGTGDTKKREVPVKIEVPGVRFVAVAASIFNKMSVAVTEDGRRWVWGECWSGSQLSKSVLIPKHVGSASLHDAFADFGQPPVTWKPFFVRQPPTNQVIDRFKSAFDDLTTTDFKFIVDGKEIHVHRSLLKIQSQHFQTMFSDEWSELNKDEVEVKQWSYPVFYSFVKYFYTGEVDLPIDQIIKLYGLANLYSESVLEIKCHRLIRQNLKVENAALAYASACKSNAKSVEEYCFQFIIDHLDDVEKTEAFQSLDEEIRNKFI